MALVLADRVLETTSVAGTGDASLSGAVTGYQPFSVIGGGNTTYYTIVAIDDNGVPTGDWEVGIGTYVTSGNKISRDTVLSSSNGGALVYFASGNKQIFLDLPSEELPVASGDVTGPASAVANNFAAFNMTTGKLIKDSGYNASSFATAAQGTLADTAIQPGDLGTAAYLDAGSALGVATLDAGGKVPTSQIPQMGDLNYQGTWNATTNTPTLTSSAGTKGFYYVVSVAGSTNLNGITDWKVGDWAVFNGSVWEKIDNTDAVTSVNGFTGTVVLTASDVGATPATSGTSILYGNGTGGTSNVTVGSGLTFAGGTLSASGGGDVVGPASATDNAIARFDTTTGKLIQNSVVTVSDTGAIAGVIQEDYTAVTPPAYLEGRTFYDTDAKTLCYYNDNSQMTLNIGQEQVVRVRNQTGATITNGTVVYVNGATGNTPLITKAIATSFTTADIIGVTTTDIANNAHGYVTISGIVNGLDTSAFAEGDAVFLSATTAGTYTTTEPVKPNYSVQVGIILRANPSVGTLLVSIQMISSEFTHVIGTASVDQGGTGQTSYTNGQLLIGNTTGNTLTKATLTAGTGVSVTNGAGSITLTNTAPDQTVAITGAGGAVVTGTYPNFTITTPSGTVTSVTGTAPIASTGGATPAISISQATTSTNGYLSSTDWNTFNNKQPAGSYLTAVTASTPLSGSGTVGSPLVIAQATTSTSGFLSSTDWNTFNGKGSGTVTSVGGTGTVNGITLTGTVTSTGNLTLGGTLGGIGNSQLTNSAVTIGSTSVSLGATATTLAGLTSVTSTTVVASGVVGSSATGALTMPSGTTAERPGTPVTGMVRYNTSLSVVEYYNGSAWAKVTATIPNPTPTVEYLVVAGGGGGGSSPSGDGGGGGGAGGYRTATGLSVSSGSAITVTVGGGGAAGTSSAIGGNGGNSVFSSITSTGGGAGGRGTTSSQSGVAGGSGGGSGFGTTGIAGGAASPSGQGNAGGASTTAYGGGGGGGASAAGSNGATNGGNGGNGTASSISGSSVTYAGGGGGGCYIGTGGSAGTGGGGAGKAQAGGAGDNGTANTGGGGGGTGSTSGGTGGSGIVIIRYADTYDAATATTGSPTITVAGGYRVYKWTGSGSITF